MSEIIIARDHELPGQVCPVCKKELDRAACANPDNVKGPSTGDISLCNGCGAILLFDRELQIVEPNEDQWKAIREDVETYTFLQSMQEAIRAKRVVLIKGF